MKKKGLVKRMASLFMAGVMTLGLAACGSTGSSSESSTGSEEVAETDAASEAQTENSQSAEGKTQISFWAPLSGADGDNMTALVDQFNSESSTTQVEFMIVKSSEYYTKFLAAMTTDSAPDVAICHISRVKEYMSDDLLELLDELAAAVNVDWSGFTERLQQASLIDGTHYCMPMDTHLLLMHYDVDECSRLGVLAEDGTVQVPEGEEGFLQFFENIKANSTLIPIAGTSTGSLPMYLWYTLLGQYGGDICDAEGKTATLDSDANRSALEFMMKMVDEEIWPKNQKSGAELFTGKMAAANIGGDWNIPVFEKNEDLNYVSMAFPQIGPNKAVYADSHTLVIPKSETMTDQEKASAIEFMKWLIDHNAEWALPSGHIPSQTAVIESGEFLELPNRANYAASADYAKFFPQVSGTAGLIELAQRELSAMIAGEQDVDTTMEHMQKQFQEILDSYQ